MLSHPRPLRSRLRRLVLPAFVGAALAGAALPAAAQSIAVVVNGQPILSSEVTGRVALMNLAGGGKGGSVAAARQELIDEKLKLTEAKRYNMVVSDEQVEAAFASIAQRTKLSPAQFTQAIGQRGVPARTLKDRLKAEISWAQLVRRKFASQIAAREKDVVSSVGAAGKADNRATQYTLRQVVFVLPKNASDAQVNQRRAEANAARGRFPGCAQAVQFASSLRDVAVKEPITRSTAQLGKPISDNLAKVKVGGLTSPERSEQGVEMIAICERKDIADDSMIRRQAAEELGSKQAEEQSKKYLEQLKSRAIIEVRG
ncbi:peptidyl-prolyl cis-trans isomerase SurA [Methylopila capsulata]|uniref:Molecular chaperone SurA n=1 Tax=Methylopila capsulata TaxID=61654 RepID=A0A9W6IUJ0_9HYPH|nr:SurA N-terminal domain-containing protein [Methylopila capsulata]MBM7850291.1 peptidyl-prolyl cis-trans isomerase SurA [Methylopila capsulata]GLK55584.1 molecular chaperone SurA [Methylopila capsulata]